MRIGDVARRSGVEASAIRYYERIGILPGPGRVSGQRRYDPSVLERLRVVTLGRRIGFSLEEIGTLVSGIGGHKLRPAWRLLATKKLAELDTLLRETRALRELLVMGPVRLCPALGLQSSGLDGVAVVRTRPGRSSESEDDPLQKRAFPASQIKTASDSLNWRFMASVST